MPLKSCFISNLLTQTKRDDYFNAIYGFAESGPAKSKGFLVVQSNGGLNQMRAGVCFLII